MTLALADTHCPLSSRGTPLLFPLKKHTLPPQKEKRKKKKEKNWSSEDMLIPIRRITEPLLLGIHI
jgi:hypothetical protein